MQQMAKLKRKSRTRVHPLLQSRGRRRAAQTVPPMVLDIFQDVGGTLGGNLTDGRASFEKAEQHLPGDFGP